jgi:hypothetical protein
MARPRRDDLLDEGAHTLREHLVEFAPGAGVARLESATSGEVGRGIGVPATDDASHVVRWYSLECS